MGIVISRTSDVLYALVVSLQHMKKDPVGVGPGVQGYV